MSRKLKQKAAVIFERLLEHYPDASCDLHYEGPFQLLVATILSAQCTDVQVNKVTPRLFAHFGDAAQMAQANLSEVEALIRSTGFFQTKARYLVEASRLILQRFGGAVPATLAQLQELPGVGRKTANVVLGNAFHRNEGIVVDTHVKRISGLLGLTKETKSVEVIEQDLIALFPREQWTMVAHLIIRHGRRLCVARRPQCEHCFLQDLCDFRLSQRRKR